MGWSPEKSVMHQQQIRLRISRHLNGGEARIDCGSDSPDTAIVLDLQAVDRALSDALGKRPLNRQAARSIDALAGLDAAWVLVYMVRCAFAHDPFNPRWECRGRYLGTLRVAALNLTVDLRERNGQRLQPDEFGGLGGYMSLLQFLQGELQARLHGEGAKGAQ